MISDRKENKSRGKWEAFFNERGRIGTLSKQEGANDAHTCVLKQNIFQKLIKCRLKSECSELPQNFTCPE